MRPLFRFGFCVVLLAAAMVPAGVASAQAPLSDSAAPMAAPADPAKDLAQPAPVQPQPTQPGSAETEAQATAEPSATPLTLPRDLSPWGMFMAADIVVKAVMVGLAFASLVTWTVWLAKSIEIAGAGLRARHTVKAIAQARSLAEAGSSLDGRGDPATYLVRAAAEEVALSSSALDHVSGDGLKERVTSRLARIEAAAVRRLSRGTGVLATIGSTAPFVGLFGTVWGIMKAFQAIAIEKSTNLAVVAPSIAEA